MIQLTFQAALDPFHAMFRLLRLREIYRIVGRVSVDQARILDFYLIFPFRVADLRLRPEHRKFRRLSTSFADLRPYGEQPEDRMLFERMAPMQVAAMETLASNEYYSSDEMRTSWLVPTSKEVRSPIQDRILEINAADGDLIQFLSTLAVEYPVSGTNGLKHRSALMEHRYDVI
jgi:hypothetical protein